MPPSFAGGQPNLIVIMSPVANQNIPPTPPYVCDTVDLTISFPSPATSAPFDTVRVSANATISGLPILFTDNPSGSGYIPSGDEAIVTVVNTPGLTSGRPATLTIASTNDTTVSSTPVSYPDTNYYGYDVTTYYSSRGTTSQIQVQDVQ